MYCRWCAAPMEPTAALCPACGRPQNLPPPPTARDSIDDVVAEARRAAHEVADTAEKLSRKATHEAKRAVEDPKDAWRRAMQKVRKEIEEAKRDLDTASRHLE